MYLICVLKNTNNECPPSSGISSSFCFNSSNPHLLRRDVLAERKWRDGYNCRCRDVYTRNQGKAEDVQCPTNATDIFLWIVVLFGYHTGLWDHKIITKTRLHLHNNAENKEREPDYAYKCTSQTYDVCITWTINLKM